MKNLNFKTSNEIIKESLDYLENPDSNRVFADGLISIHDLSNAFKIIYSWKVFQSRSLLHNDVLSELKSACEESDSILRLISSGLLPNSKRQYSDFQEMQSTTSFLDFCYSIRDSNTYWIQIFEKLTISCDDSNPLDRINEELNKELETTSDTTEVSIYSEIQDKVEGEQKAQENWAERNSLIIYWGFGIFLIGCHLYRPLLFVLAFILLAGIKQNLHLLRTTNPVSINSKVNLLVIIVSFVFCIWTLIDSSTRSWFFIYMVAILAFDFFFQAWKKLKA